ncbi:hypothetical protein GN956_G10055 [Arapaima gigas]
MQPRGRNTAEAGSASGRKAACKMAELKQAEQEEDTLFPVKIQGAGIEPFELQVHGFWLVQDVVLAVLKRDEVAPRTSLSLSLSGVTLDPFCELQAIKGFKPGATLRLVEEPYTPRMARAHLAHLQELLRAPGSHDALREGRSPSVLSALSPTHGTETSGSSHTGKGAKRGTSEPKPEQQTLEGPPPDYILPGSKERPLLPLLPSSMHTEVANCLTDLSLSSWNPPPGPRKLQGDFFYITVCTLEGRWCDITSCPRGFFLNRSTLDTFDPRPASSSPLSHCLADLLSQLSPGFKKAFAAVRNRSQLPPLENMPTPYRTLCWLGPPSAIRSHRTSFSSRLGLEEHAGAQAPDWNEELQAARDLSQSTLEDRLLRDRAMLQVNSAFVWAAAQGAEAAIDGCVAPIGGGEEDAAFLLGSLFLSQGGNSNNVPGGERGRRALQRLELRGVQAYSGLEGTLQGLHTLPTAVVDYRGFRLSVQGLAPGLDGVAGPEGMSKGLLYGVSAGVLEGPHRRKLLELLAQAAKSLFLQRHTVVGPGNFQVPLFTSAHTQGLMGADGRFYLINLFHMQPVDANFQLPEKEGNDSQEEKVEGDAPEGWTASYLASSGFPRSFPHGLCQLRPELTQAFIQHKWVLCCVCVSHLHACAQTGDKCGIEAARAACKDVGSVSDIIFEMRFNPDVFSPGKMSHSSLTFLPLNCIGMEFPSSERDAVQLQERLLREAAKFIITDQIPAFVEDCLESRVSPVDGTTLCQAMHQRGINLRYLGHLAKAISQSEHRERLRHITRLANGEIVVRSARRVLNPYLQAIEVSSLSAAVSHFLCCLLVSHFPSAAAGEEPKKRSRRRGRGGGASAESTAWSALSGTDLWSLLNQDAKETYNLSHSLGTSADDLVDQYGLQKISLLRRFCLLTGIQLRLREYTLDNSTKAPISPDDIINIFPVVKHVIMTTSDATQVFRSAHKSIQKGQMYRAYEQLKEAAYLFGRVCDDLHPEACACLSSLARLAYLHGNSAEARSLQLKAVVVSERVLGFDHPGTIQEYALLAVYVFAGRELGLAQRCLYRARLLMLLVHGEDHPYMATLDVSVPQPQASRCKGQKPNTNEAEPFLSATPGYKSWIWNFCIYNLCMIHVCVHEQCGEDHQQTRSSMEFLRAITQQAVRIERSLRQGSADLTDTAPPESLMPTVESTLEQLALVNGIVKVPVSNKILELQEKLKEMKASNEMKDEKQKVASANGGGRTERPGREEESVHGDINGSEEAVAGDGLKDASGLQQENHLDETSTSGLAFTRGEDQMRPEQPGVEATVEKKSDSGGVDGKCPATTNVSVPTQCNGEVKQVSDDQLASAKMITVEPAEESGIGEISGAAKENKMSLPDLNGEGEHQATCN